MSGDENFIKEHPLLAARLLNHSFDACLICVQEEQQLKTVYANRTYFKLTGKNPDEVLGLQPQISDHKKTGENLYSDILASYHNREEFERECSCLNKNATSFWVRLKSFTLEADDSETPYAVILLQEITDRKNKERELIQALETAESSKEIKNQFLANMSHEMRTPLNGILGIAQLLESSPLRDKQDDYVQEIKHSAENLLAIVNDILEFNFLKSSDFKLDIREFNIHRQFQQIIKTIRDRAEKKSLELNLVISDQVPEKLIGDSVRLTQIMMNLLGNAIKFTKEGAVSLFVRTLDEQNGRLPVEIKVKDTGIGIPESIINEIFDTFNQTSRNSSYKYGGSGLGLSIVRQLVGHMDGRIEVESREGRGTEFTLTIPFERPEKSKKYTSLMEFDSPENRERFTGHRILIVDDYTVNRRIVKGMMEKLGVEVDEAEDGESALDKIEDNDYSAIFMDVHMPGISGLEATRKIREMDNEKKNSLPVIAVTASVLSRDIEECKNAGMDGFIAKPFTFNELYERFKSYVIEHTEIDEQDQHPPEESGSTLNMDALREMTGGDTKLLKEMLDLFLNQTPVLMKALTDHFKNGDLPAVKTTAHTLKPTFSYVGMDKAMNIAEQIELIANREDPPVDELEDLISELKEICHPSIAKLISIRSEIS